MPRLKEFFAGRLPELIMFDLDGTLVDSVPDLAAAVDDMLEALDMPVAGINKVTDWVGNGAAMLVKRALCDGDHQAVDRMTDAEAAPALALFHQYYAQHNGKQTTIYPGVIQALKQFQALAIPMAVVTNKPERHTKALLNQLSEHADMIHFDWVVGGDTLPERKPHPAPLLFSLEQAGVQAENALMIGDSINDVQAARRANVPVICVSYGYNHGHPIESCGADAVIDSLDNLLYC